MAIPNVRQSLAALPAAALLFTAPSADAQTVNDLTGTGVFGGMSIEAPFFEFLTEEIEAQVRGRLAADSFSDFDAYVGPVNAAYDAAMALVNLGAGNIDLPSFCTVYPETCVQPWFLFATGVFRSACGTPVVELDLDVASGTSSGGFRMGDLTFDPIPGGQAIDLRLRDVGWYYGSDLSVEIGNCDLYTENFESRFTFDALDYRAVVTWSGQTPVVSVSLVTNLANVSTDIDILGWSVDGDFAINVLTELSALLPNVQLTQPMTDWATINVPLMLEQLLTEAWLPYLVPDGSPLSLNMTDQNAAYAANDVDTASGVWNVNLLDTRFALTRSAVLTDFAQSHGPVVADPQAINGVGAFARSLATPDFDDAVGADMGMYFLNAAGIQHVVTAGVISAIGLRDDDKDAGTNPLRVEVPFASLAPEHAGRTVEDLLGTGSTASPIAPVPVSMGQALGLDALAPSPLGDFGDRILHDLQLIMEIRDIDRSYQMLPLSGDDFAIVRHDVVLSVAVAQGTIPLFAEVFDAKMETRLRLIHDRESNSKRFHGTQTQITSLVNRAGFPWDLVGSLNATQETPVSAAPVSLFLRAMFGWRTATPNFPDQRAFYLFEGIAGPLVERTVQGFVRLPGLDMEPNATSVIGRFGALEPYVGETTGMSVEMPHLCAQLGRWGSTIGLPSATPGESQEMFAMEVRWQPTGPAGISDAQSSIGFFYAPLFDEVNATSESIDDMTTMTLTYVAGFDAARIANATGYRTGPFLVGGGSHHVAATAAGYERLRSTPAIRDDINASIELVPYRGRGLAGLTCGSIDADNPAGSIDPRHHDGTPYAVWTADAYDPCVGPGECDTSRIGVLWTAPLFGTCAPAQYWEVAVADFTRVTEPLRNGPDDIVVQPNLCAGNPKD